MFKIKDKIRLNKSPENIIKNNTNGKVTLVLTVFSS